MHPFRGVVRALILVALVASLSVVGVSPAIAQGSMSLTPDSGPVGTKVRVHLKNLEPNGTEPELFATIFFDGEAVATVVNECQEMGGCRGMGTFSVPDLALEGRHIVTATTEIGEVVQAMFMVKGPRP